MSIKAKGIMESIRDTFSTWFAERTSVQEQIVKRCHQTQKLTEADRKAWVESGGTLEQLQAVAECMAERAEGVMMGQKAEIMQPDVDAAQAKSKQAREAYEAAKIAAQKIVDDAYKQFNDATWDAQAMSSNQAELRKRSREILERTAPQSLKDERDRLHRQLQGLRDSRPSSARMPVRQSDGEILPADLAFNQQEMEAIQAHDQRINTVELQIGEVNRKIMDPMSFAL